MNSRNRYPYFIRFVIKHITSRGLWVGGMITIDSLVPKFWNLRFSAVKMESKTLIRETAFDNNTVFMNFYTLGSTEGVISNTRANEGLYGCPWTSSRPWTPCMKQSSSRICHFLLTVLEMSVYKMWHYSILAHNTSKFVREHISNHHVNDHVRRARISDEHLITLKLIYKIYHRSEPFCHYNKKFIFNKKKIKWWNSFDQDFQILLNLGSDNFLFRAWLVKRLFCQVTRRLQFL